MNENFERERQRKMNYRGISRTARKYWKGAKPPVLGSVHKTGTDGKLHYSTSHSSLESPKHERETDKIINACGGAGAHNSGAKCAEHGAMDSFYKNNPMVSIEGANSYAYGQRSSDRKNGIPPGPQEACKGEKGKKGCEDHLAKAGINDLTKHEGTQPSQNDNRSPPKQSPPSESPSSTTSKLKPTVLEPSSSKPKQTKGDLWR